MVKIKYLKVLICIFLLLVIVFSIWTLNTKDDLILIESDKLSGENVSFFMDYEIQSNQVFFTCCLCIKK